MKSGWALVGLAVMVAACSGASSVPSPTPTAMSTSILVTYGPAPKDCPASPQPRPVSPSVGPVVGQAPLWALGFEPAEPAPVLTHRGPRDTMGIPFKVFWVMAPGSKTTVQVTITETRTATSAWISQAADSSGTTATFDPARTNVISSPTAGDAGGAIGFPSSVSIARPGCYEIEASWQGGKWTQIFAAGTNG